MIIGEVVGVDGLFWGEFVVVVASFILYNAWLSNGFINFL